MVAGVAVAVEMAWRRITSCWRVLVVRRRTKVLVLSGRRLSLMLGVQVDS